MNKLLDAKLLQKIDSGRIPGVVAMVANADGILYEGAAGKRSIESGVPMTPDTIVAVASMTKAITTTGLLQLVDQGLVELDLPAAKYLPQLHSLKILPGFDTDGQAILIDPISQPTVRQLLTHTSGFVYEIWNANAQQSVTSGQTQSLFIPGGDGINAPLGFEPGTRWEYGIGIDWAGVLIESLSGKRLDRYFKDHIFSPLGMPDTFYDVPEEKSDRLASLHARGDKGFTVTPHLSGGDFKSGGGGLYSTVSDYTRFMRALINGGSLDGQEILDSSTVDMMFQNQISGLTVEPGQSQLPEISNGFDMGFGASAKWGLGFLLHTNGIESGRSRGSVSWAGLFNSYYWIDRKQGICAVIATQILPFYDDDVVELLLEFEQIIYENL
jgi:methyl acetate hydrolase